MPKTIRQIDQGLNATVDDPAELKRGAAADKSKNVLYSRGTVKTPFGFGKVSETSLPLDSGNPVLSIFKHSELDKTEHVIAVTNNKIYDRDYPNDLWNEKTQAYETTAVDLNANEFNPVSHASVLHTDGLALNGSGDDWYHHSLVCPGTTDGPIQRWAGKFETDYADLLGADGYHDAASGVTKHYAMQVGIHYNHVILVSAYEANANGDLIANSQRVRWGAAGKLEVYSGSGTGTSDLLDTGDYNVWSAQLGSQYLVYQSHSVWSLNHVGGTTVYDPRIEMPDLGLLSSTLLFTKNNIHYFIGNDYNLYSYLGGSALTRIGDKLHKYLQRDLAPAYASRSWMTMGAQNSRLWLYIVPNGSTYATCAYGIDVRTGAWMKRDLTHKWATGGISTVALVGAGSYDSGITYREQIAAGTTNRALEILTTTNRQLIQEVLTDESIILGDSDGNVYQYDSDLTTDDTVSIPSRHITEVWDGGTPGIEKLWPGIRISAKGTGLVVSYRFDSFDTENDGWIDIVVDEDTSSTQQALTSKYLNYEYFVQDTGENIQFSFSNIPDSDAPTTTSGDDFQISNYTLLDPTVEGTV